MVTGAIFVEQSILAEFSKIQSVTHLDANKQMSLFIQLYNCIKSFEDYIRLPEKSAEKSVIKDFFSKLFTIISCGLESNSVLEVRKSDPGNSHVEDTSGVKNEINSTTLSSSFESETRVGVCNTSDAELLLTQTVASSEDTDNSLENTEMKKTPSTIHSAILVSSSEHIDSTNNVVKKGCKREKRDTSGVRRSGRHTRLPVKLSSQEFVGLEDAGLKSGKHTSNKAVKLSSVTADEKSFKTTSKDNSTNSADDDAADLAEDSGSPEQKGSEITQRKTEYKSSKQFSVKRGRKAGLKSLKSIRQFSEKPTKKKFDNTEEKESVREQAEQMSSVTNKHCTSIKIEKFQTENEDNSTDKCENSDTSQLKFVCAVCNLHFEEMSKYVDHITVHPVQANENVCKVCGLRIKTKPALIQHQRTHESKTNSAISCPTCGKIFVKKKYLKSHQLRHLGEKNVLCDSCPSRFYDRKGLYLHYNRVHLGKSKNMEPKFFCSLCSFKSYRKRDIDRHTVVHTKTKNYVCDVCGVRLAHVSSLLIHKRLHLGTKPFKCDTCGKGFSQKISLQNHERIHTGERPYKCDVCSRDFQTSSHLSRHKITHSHDLLFQCKFCDRCFARPFQVKKHVKENHTKPDSECPTLSFQTIKIEADAEDILAENGIQYQSLVIEYMD